MPIAAGGQEDERDRSGGGAGSQFRENGMSIRRRHHHVAEDQIGQGFPGDLQTTRPVFSRFGPVPLHPEDRREVPPRLFLVLNDQYCLHG